MSEILDESGVSEIEDRLHLTTDGDACFVLSNVRALCATVKHLRERFEADHELLEKVVRERNALQSQLEQLRATLARVEQNAVIDFRSRAIQLCKDKAAEWQKYEMHAREDPLRGHLLSKFQAANELREALEKL